MQVLSTKLENLHAIPLLTREIVQHNSDLRGSMQDIIIHAVIKYQVQQKSLLEIIHSATEELKALSKRKFVVAVIHMLMAPPSQMQMKM
jgi:hypothetical protein